MKKAAFAVVILAVLLVAAPLFAQDSDAIIGKWWNQEKTSQIDIYKQQGKYAGRIVWLKEPVYPADDPKGMAGMPKVDRENPDASQRNQPLLGMVAVWGFTFAGDNVWESGRIYDPRDGKTYKCKMSLKSSGVLDVRGYIGTPLFGKTNTWTRAK